MAFHNTTARYFYSLGREGLLPSALGRTHHKFKSPHIASIVQSVIAAIIIVLFAVFTGTDNPASQAYLQLYGLMAVMGVIIILSVQALVSLAILVYYERYHRDEVHWWKTRLAPILALVSQALVVYLLFDNISFLGSGYSYAKWLGRAGHQVLVAVLSEGQPTESAGMSQVEAAVRAAVSAITGESAAGARARTRRGAPEGRNLGAPHAGQRAGTTTVFMILSARVCRLASHNGNRKPTKQASQSRMWQMSRAKAMPGPIGSPVDSLTSLRPSAFFPHDWPVVPAWYQRL